MKNPDKILCADGYPLDAISFPAKKEAKGVIIIASALGVHHRYYHRFADFLAANAYHVICFNCRGTGLPGGHKSGSASMRLIEWGTKDVEAVIQSALTYEKPVYLLGHSIGGQLFPMADSAHHIEKAFLVAASAPYWKRWAFPVNLGLLFFSSIFMPMITRLRKTFPNQALGLGNLTIDSPLMREWAQWMLRPDYFLDSKFHPEAKTRFSSFENPVMAIGFTDDQMAPENNIRALMQFYKGNNKRTRIFNSNAELKEKVGHNGFFKAKFADSLWQEVLDYFER